MPSILSTLNPTLGPTLDTAYSQLNELTDALMAYSQNEGVNNWSGKNWDRNYATQRAQEFIQGLQDGHSLSELEKKYPGISQHLAPFVARYTQKASAPGAGGSAAYGATGAAGPAGGGTLPTDPYMQAAAPTQQNPWGQKRTTVDANGNLTQTTALGGSLGAANTSLEKMYADMLSKGLQSGEAARQQAIDSAYGQATSRLDPQWAKREEAMRTQLLNQGLDPTSEAGKNAMAELGLQRNDAYSSAMNSAIGIGNQAGNDVFRNNLAAFQVPLQQMGQLKGLSQQQADPSLLNAYIAQQNNKLGLAGQAQQNQADWTRAAMQLGGSLAQGVGDLAQSWLKSSSSNGYAPIGYDASGTPYYSNPSDWSNPYSSGGY